MTYCKHVSVFGQLGQLFSRFASKSIASKNDEWLQKLKDALVHAEIQNKWFTQENLLHAMKQWGNLLENNKLEAWQANYSIKSVSPKTVAIIMAGNIPLVGFHDFLCTIFSGHKVLVKLSSKDTILLPFIKSFLVAQCQELESYIHFTEERLSDFDAVIATGSNNTSRYFEYYFGKYPSIIRKNRNSVAIIRGNENKKQLENLGKDIFQYFGLGCRSVSKIFVPKGYSFDAFFNAIFAWREVINHHKYANNYDYNKAVYLMSAVNILHNGFLILKKDSQYASPIATLFFEYYTDLDLLRKQLSQDSESIQCIVSEGFMANEIPFGQTQSPKLSDYADDVNTMTFLQTLSSDSNL